MNRQELEDKLAIIGWRVEKSWNGLNDFIINHLDERTSFVVRETQLEIRTELFGESSFMGSVHFKLEDIVVKETRPGGNEVTDCITLDFNKTCFIQFYNHDLNKKKDESRLQEGVLQ